MPRRRVAKKKTVKEANDPQIPLDQEVECQCAAIRAIRDVEIERSLIGLRLLRSNFNEEQLKTSALKFFRESFPNLSISTNAENDEFEVHWIDKDDNLSLNQIHCDSRDLHASLLHRLSVAYYNPPPDSSAIPSLGGFELSSDPVRTSMFGVGVDSLQMKVLDGPSDSQMLVDGLQTPGVSSQRMSIGTTPKTLRLPKPGEMLLSVRGSPLGVYKEDNMEAIHESEEC